MKNPKDNLLLKRSIIAISLLVPLIVAVLYFFIPNKAAFNVDVSFLPKLNASINFTVACLLVLGLFFIKKKDMKKHQISMFSAFLLSAIFLISYVVYHFFSESTRHGGTGIVKYIYLFILLTHIVFSTIVLPFILFSFYYAHTLQYEAHRKLSKITWPIWFYVSVSGVLVYFLISPYY